MSKRLDSVLAALDVGLQTPAPDPTYGEVSPRVSDRCARCDSADTASESEFCGSCRSFLLGDAPDPMLPALRPTIHARFVEFGAPAVVAGGLPVAIREAWQRVADTLLDAITPVYEWWSEHRGLFVESVTFGVATDVLSHADGWGYLNYLARQQVYAETCAYPVLTMEAVPGAAEDPLRVLIRAEWSRLDPVFDRSYTDVGRPDDWTPLNLGIVRADVLQSTNDFTVYVEPVCGIIPPRDR